MSMRMRATLKSTALLICAVSLLGVTRCPERPGAPKHRNILLIIAHDLSYDQYGFAGHPVVQTPSIDSLAAESIRYSSAYVSSTCRPTLATLLTGLHEHQHGVSYIGGPRIRDFVTVPDRLGAVGYSSFQAGKFWEGNPTLQGFTDFAPFDAGTGDLSIGRVGIQPLYDFIETTQSPWFISFSPFMPHAPHEAPQEYIERYQGLGLDGPVIAYYAMISWFDDVVGELLLEVDDDTVVIYLADNGYRQSAHANFRGPKSKHSSYEGGTRTQLLIRYPDRTPHARFTVVDAVDVVATILGIAGADAADLPGRDILNGNPFKWSAIGSRSTLGIFDQRGILLDRWIRLADWKLVDVEGGEDRLHNLRSDPDELENRIDDPRVGFMASILRSELEERFAE
jgi:arylsulfatase A-like enzyme